MFKMNKRRSLALGLILTLAIAGGAFAYWTGGTGSGTGSGAVASGVTPVSVTQTTTLTPMYPGDSAQSLAGTLTNPNTSAIHVSSITISSVTTDKGAACDGTDFTYTSPGAVNLDVPGNGSTAWSGGSIQFNNKPTTNQDACKGAVVTITYSAS